MKRDWKYWMKLEAAIVLLTIGVYFFKTPNNFATGGVSGVSLLLARVFPVLSQAEYMAIFNVLLLIAGALVLGRDCGALTVFCTLQFSALNWLLEKLLPLKGPLTDQPLMELLYAMVLSGIASAVLFECGASSGGTDIIAMILRKYTSLDIGRALLATDLVIAVSGFFINGVKAGLYSLMGLFLKTFLIDSVIESLNLCKAFTIVTTRPEEIASFIMEKIGHGVTEYEAKGAYTGEGRTVLVTVCRRADAARLRRFARSVDPSAFMIITNSSEVVGRGFLEV